MISLLMVTLLAQAEPMSRGPVVVVIASKRSGAEVYSPELAAAVHRAIVAAGLNSALDDETSQKLMKRAKVTARTCQGATSCLLKTAFALGPRAVVVGVDVGKNASSLAVHLEMVAADVVGPLASVDFSSSISDWRSSEGAQIETFAREAADKLRAVDAPRPPPLATSDRPRPDDGEPTSQPAESQLVPPPQRQVSPSAGVGVSNVAPRSRAMRVVPWVTTVAAIVGVGVSGTFAVLGNTDKISLDASLTTVDGQRVSSFGRAEYEALAERGNTRFTIALISGLAGLALAVLSVVLFATGN